jgi:hypothetical protein
MRSPVIHWLYRLSTFDFGTNLGYSLTGVGDAVVLVLMASVGVVRVVIVVGAAAVEIVTVNRPHRCGWWCCRRTARASEYQSEEGEQRRKAHVVHTFHTQP